uniref:FIP-RBD domain-containing protein n=1 Tax=Syphacia muris TaxID=451379 RepID=A0A0N5AE87_9BILA
MKLCNSSSSASVASRLYTNGARGSGRGSFGSEPELMSFSDNENSIHELNEICNQVSTLSKKVNDMEEERLKSSEERSRLKTENAVLMERVHILEEQLQAAEIRWKEKLSEERARNRDIVSRMEREKQLEIESCVLKYQVLEKDFTGLRKENEKIRDGSLSLEKDLLETKEKLSDSNLLCDRLTDDLTKLEREYKKFREEAQQDIDSSSELVEELSRQTDELRRQKEAPLPMQGTLTDQMRSLEGEIERLRVENKDLRKENEDLQAQLLHDSVERGQTLLADGVPSLAEELNGKDSTELMNALKEQEICNQKLRVYINGILMRVIELHPEILEIKDNGEQFSKSNS